MSGTFFKIKRKYLLNAVIISVAIALSVGLLAVGATMLGVKLAEVEFNPVLYLPIGLGSAIVVGAPLILFLIPTDKRLAKKLDENLALNEKVQTMIEFAGDDSSMAAIQRADTEKRLISVPFNTFNLKKWWAYVIAVVLSCAVFCTAFFIPGKEEAPVVPPTEEVFVPTDFQLKQLELLIEYVEEDADFVEVARQAVLVELEVLHEMVKSEEEYTKGEMDTAVLAAITDIHAAVDGVNSYKKIASTMLLSADENVLTIAKTLGSLSIFTVGDGFIKVGESYSDKTGQDLYDGLIVFASYFDIALTGNGVDSSDALLVALKEFPNQVRATAEIIKEDETEEVKQNRISNLFSSNENAVGRILDQISIQNDNRDERDIVVEELLDIFGLTEDDLPTAIKDKLEEENQAKYPEDKEDDKLGDGGMGSGETIYGSNDAVFDPETATHVKYGEIINQWYEEGRLNDGTVPEELKQLYLEYISYLDGNKDKFD